MATVFISAFAVLLAISGLTATSGSAGANPVGPGQAYSPNDGLGGPVASCSPNDPKFCGMD